MCGYVKYTLTLNNHLPDLYLIQTTINIFLLPARQDITGQVLHDTLMVGGGRVEEGVEHTVDTEAGEKQPCLWAWDPLPLWDISLGMGNKLFCLHAKLQGNIPKQHHTLDNKGALEGQDKKDGLFQKRSQDRSVSKAQSTYTHDISWSSFDSVSCTALSFHYCRVEVEDCLWRLQHLIDEDR